MRGSIEERVQRRAKRNQIRDVILLSAYVAIGASMMIMTPNAMRLLKHVEKVIGPSPSLKRRVSQKYSELIAQGIFKRINSSGGSRIELTEKGKRLAEELALRDELRQALDPRESVVLFLRFGLNGTTPQTLEEIGQKYNVTREWIRQIENRALKKLSRSPEIIKRFKEDIVEKKPQSSEIIFPPGLKT